MADVELNPVADNSELVASLNQNFVKIEDKLNATLTNEVGAGNMLGDTLDANSQRIINLPSPRSSTDAARLVDVSGGSSIAVPALLGNAGKILSTDGVAAFWIDRDLTTTPELFSAVGDGTADDTAAIQSAINYCIANNKILMLPSGKNYSVSGVSVNLTASADDVGFGIVGEHQTKSRLTKRGSSSTPLISITQSTEPQYGNVFLSNFALFGNSKNCDGLKNTAVANVTLDRLWVRNFDVGINWLGAINNQVNTCVIIGNNVGIKARANASLSAYSNANTLRNCVINDNSSFAVDVGQGSNLRTVDCDLERNGTTGNVNTGTYIFRSTVDDEIGYSVFSIRGSWIEQSYGRAIQCEAVSGHGMYLNISDSNIITSESGRAFYSAGGGVYGFKNVIIPSPGDTVDATCTRLIMDGCILFTLAGTRAADATSISNTLIGGAPVEGTHQTDIQVGGGNGVTFSWASGAGAYKINSNTITGDLNFTNTVGGSGVSTFNTNLNLVFTKTYRIDGQQVVGGRLAAITAPTGGAVIDAESRTAINTIISRLQTHGLIS